MPTIELRTQVTVEDLLIGVEQLPTPSLEEFVSRALDVRAKRRAPSLNKNESLLLQKINRAIPENLQIRYRELDTKRRDEELSPEEHQELLTLIDKIEQLNAERISYLGKLAQQRNISLRALMKQLGLSRPVYA